MDTIKRRFIKTQVSTSAHWRSLVRAAFLLIFLFSFKASAGTCPEIVVANGYLSETTNQTQNPINVYATCNYGAGLPRGQGTCQSDGTWTNIYGCGLWTCSITSYDDNVIMSNTGVLIGDTTDYSCPSGYELIGPDHTVCDFLYGYSYWLDNNSRLIPHGLPKCIASPLNLNSTFKGINFHFSNK